MPSNFHVVIPARMQSTRLPGKLLIDLQGKTVLERVYLQALKAGPLSITIATDSEHIFNVAKAFGADVVMTALTHQSGTDRIAEAVKKLGFAADDIIVNVQGDEPLIAPALITQVALSLMNTEAPMATLCWPVEDEEHFNNPNVVKVVRDHSHHALYFSRSPIPACRDGGFGPHAFRHIGLYAYRAAFLLDVVTWPVCELEQVEALEQLRILWSGHKIKVDVACVKPLQDINTAQDLEAARRELLHLC